MLLKVLLVIDTDPLKLSKSKIKPVCCMAPVGLTVTGVDTAVFRFPKVVKLVALM